jgi:hypothetical protein
MLTSAAGNLGPIILVTVAVTERRAFSGVLSAKRITRTRFDEPDGPSVADSV